ncbi:hypothetical protein C1903_06435 [Listeria ivanovii]|uniref:hypothetical protein n=1 Tax=Listeria ivanovii TaxID=1638 RepID=UPI000DA8655C|nr:hypothetical protein [Listeria ivanovii]PZF89315.1 hypothetical protein C1905_07265 [Listeria ivanovii]PZF94667.1 hypothetical protein C1903_06435 [Listeria ivanovii]PZG05187.1 hypothetical protein C2L88_06430 [Listeria ivanovii]PZG09859.1 hypothetical protein C1901_06430 [Listeria ivanovii]PZG26722.1 hypothetical protein C1900_07270 [Listeria ivanovii]
MKNKAEKQRIATNLSLYMKINGYTNRTFALAVGISQNTLKALMIGKMRNESKFQKYIMQITESLALEENFFEQPKEAITTAPITFQDTNKKMHLGDEKFNAISLMLKIGEIHYES